MTQNPTRKAVTFNYMAYKYGAINFQDKLAQFIACTNHPHASVATLSGLASDMLIPFCSVLVYHKIKFTSDEAKVVDVIHIWPEQKGAHGCLVPSHFDTVIVHGRTHVGVE
jgi:hypothetical protein